MDLVATLARPGGNITGLSNVSPDLAAKRVPDQRGQLLRAAVGFAGCSMPSYDRALHALRTWLDSWAGIGHVAVGMHRQGYDLQLTQYDERGWRATFYTTGMEHSPTSATGTGWKRTSWHDAAAALDALMRVHDHAVKGER